MIQLRKQFTDLKGVRVVEWHPGGHGWHIHWMTTAWLPVQSVRLQAQRCHFGRVNVLVCGSEGTGTAEYMAKHFSKDRIRCPGMRKWACTGGYKGSLVKQITLESDYTKWRKEYVGKQIKLNFQQEIQLHNLWLFGTRKARSNDAQKPTPF
jgi:hypothetical protein